MKRTIVTLITGLFAAFMSVTVLAADTQIITAESTGTTAVTYTAHTAYTVEIPAQVIFRQEQSAADVRIYGSGEEDPVLIGKGKTVSVSLDDDNSFLAANSGDILAYTAAADGCPVTAGSIIAETASNTTVSRTLTFTRSVPPQKSGTYTGTMNFQIALIDTV